MKQFNEWKIKARKGISIDPPGKSRMMNLQSESGARRRMKQPIIRSSFIPIIVSGISLMLPSLSCRALVINPIWDTSITADANAAIIQNTINAAIAVYQANFSDPISVAIKFHETTVGLGANTTYYSVGSYAYYHSRLLSDATTANDTTALGTLPNTVANPVVNNSSIALTTANWRAIGVNVNPPAGQPDSFIYLNTSLMNLDRNNINLAKYDLMAVVMHEIDEALGIGSGLNGLANGASAPSLAWNLDMFRFDANGNRSFNTALATLAYFSINGTNALARFNQTAGGDFSDFYSTGPHTPQVQDAFGTPGATPNLGVELTMLDVLGYNLVMVPEPGTFALVALGLGGFCGRKILKRNSESGAGQS